MQPHSPALKKISSLILSSVSFTDTSRSLSSCDTIFRHYLTITANWLLSSLLLLVVLLTVSTEAGRFHFCPMQVKNLPIVSSILINSVTGRNSPAAVALTAVLLLLSSWLKKLPYYSASFLNLPIFITKARF